MSLRKRLLLAILAGFVALVTVLALTQVEALHPVPASLLLPGWFTAAKLASAPCSATHTLKCPFWDVDYQVLNTPTLGLLWMVLDWALYASLAFYLSRSRGFPVRKPQ